MEHLLRDLGGHNVPVVATRRRDKNVRGFNSSSAQRVLIDGVSGNRLTRIIIRKSAKGRGHPVDYRNVVPCVREHRSQERSSPAGSHDYDAHTFTVDMSGQARTGSVRQALTLIEQLQVGPLFLLLGLKICLVITIVASVGYLAVKLHLA
jgi:hypothetical protein